MKQRKIDRRWIWIALGIFAMIVRYLLSFSPATTEQFYSRGFFPLIRNMIDYTFALSPVALVYFFFPILILLIIRWAKNLKLKGRKRIDIFKSTLLSIGAILGGIIFLFLILWGYNYGRIPLENQLGIKVKPLKVKEIKTELDFYTKKIITFRNKNSIDSTLALGEKYLPKDIENLLRNNIKITLTKYNYPTPGRVRGRLLKPKGTLLRFSTAGVYFPLTGECHIDAGLHTLQIPFVFLHELSHGYGITDEGSCNFMALLACMDSQNDFVKYSGYLSYWRYLAGAYKRYYPNEYSAYRKALPLAIQQDLDAINKSLYKYPDWIPRLRYVAYETYLKAQGISEGIENYNRVIMLATAWRRGQEG